MRRRKKRKKIGKTGCLFWLLVLLILVVVFLYRGKDSLKDTVTTIKRIVSGESSKDKKITEVKKPKEEEEEEEKTYETKSQEEKPVTKREPENKTSGEKSLTEIQKPSSQKKSEKRTEEKKRTEKIRIKELTTSIYFVKIEIDGTAKPVPIKRKIKYYDSPITRTYISLLNGPLPPERKRGIISFIPEGTKLISASLSNGTLTLNFNEKLEENYSGREAITLELLQILYTAFEFNSVRKVRILINNRRKQYITGEGIPLKPYYTREDLGYLLKSVA